MCRLVNKYCTIHIKQMMGVIFSIIFPSTCVLHYNPDRNLLKYQPDYYGAITDAYILYPWDMDQAGPDRVYLENGGQG